MGRMDVDFRSLRKEVGLYEGVSSRRHKDILRAAEKLFAARGYDGTTTASIAGCAGVTERTLFKHFKSKELLYRRILFPLMFRTVVPEQMEKIKKLGFTQVNKEKLIYSRPGQAVWRQIYVYQA